MSDPRHELSRAARLFYERGWMVGTAGNLSARLEDGSFWITASGRSKGDLDDGGFVRVGPSGDVVEGASGPSAETCIHSAIYALYPWVRACYHVHSIEANLVTRMEPRVRLAIFQNHATVARIAQDVRARFAADPPSLPGLLVCDHGLTTWAASPEGARNQLELFDYVFRYMVAARAIGIPGHRPT